MSAPFPWQQTLWNQLIDRQLKQTLPHALLLTGVEGFGQYTFAEAFAKQLITENQPAKVHLFDSGNHPDFFVLEPEEGSSAIKIDQVRDLQSKLTQTAHSDGYRVAIIRPAHALNNAASNALLKLVEEPPDKVLLFFIAPQLQRLSATLRSRCQQLNFQMENREASLAWLSEQLAKQHFTETAEYFLELAEDAPLTAFALAKTDAQLLQDNFLQDFILLLSQPNSAVKLAEKWAKQDINVVLPICLNLISQLICLHYQALNVNSMPVTKLSFLQQCNKQASIHTLFIIIDKIYQCRSLLAQVASLNSQALLEDIFISVR